MSPVVIWGKEAHCGHQKIERAVQIVFFAYNNGVKPRCFLLVLIILGLLEAPNAIVLVFASLLWRRLGQQLLPERVHHGSLKLLLAHPVHLPIYGVLLLAFEHKLEHLHHILVFFVLLNDIRSLLDLKRSQLLCVHVRDLSNRWKIQFRSRFNFLLGVSRNGVVCLQERRELYLLVYLFNF